MLFNILFFTLAFRHAQCITQGEIGELALDLDQKFKMNGGSPYEHCTDDGSLCKTRSFTSMIWKAAVETTAKSYVVSSQGTYDEITAAEGLTCWLESWKAYNNQHSTCLVLGEGNILKAFGDIDCAYRCVDIADVLDLYDPKDMWTKNIVSNESFKANHEIIKVSQQSSENYASYRCLGEEGCRLVDSANSICFIDGVKASSSTKDLCDIGTEWKQIYKQGRSVLVEEMMLSKERDLAGSDCYFRCLSIDREKL